MCGDDFVTSLSPLVVQRIQQEDSTAQKGLWAVEVAALYDSFRPFSWDISI